MTEKRPYFLHNKQEHKCKAIDELLNFENVLEDVWFTLLDDIKQSGATITSDLNVSEISFTKKIKKYNL